MKAKDMRNKSNKELQKQLTDMQTQLNTLLIDYKTKEVKNVKQISALKKDIARVKTVLNEASLVEGESK